MAPPAFPPPAAAAAAAVARGRRWPCPACTLLNPATSSRCSVCLAVRRREREGGGGGGGEGAAGAARAGAARAAAGAVIDLTGGGRAPPSTETSRSRKRRRREGAEAEAEAAATAAGAGAAPAAGGRQKQRQRQRQTTLFGGIAPAEARDGSSSSAAAADRFPDPNPSPAPPAKALLCPPPPGGTAASSSSGHRRLLERAGRVMRETFGIPALRSLQPLAVDGALGGRSSIVVMATGGGKSLCYQLPAAVLPGVTVVVSPLIALMVDQVGALNARGVPAAMLSSACGQRANAEVLRRLAAGGAADWGDDGGGRGSGSGNGDGDGDGNGNGDGDRDGDGDGTASVPPSPPVPLKLVYATPELIETQRFRAVLSDLHGRGGLALIAVDEAHCLSTWGCDFRPAYRKLAWLRRAFPGVPLMACTATATERVIGDIRACLDLPPGTVPCHKGSFNRANITYEVRYKDSLDLDADLGAGGDNLGGGGAMGDLLAFVRDEHARARAGGTPCSGIVYVHRRADTSALAGRITRECGGVRAAPYHAGLKDAERAEVQRLWTAGTLPVVIATVAFGMGIDRACVRYVLHWSMAKTVEGFYQESGRAGRDGLPSRSVLYYSKDDASRFAFIIKKGIEGRAAKRPSKGRPEDHHSLKALQTMADFCTSAGCRRQFLLKHFGEDSDPKSLCKRTCDYCKNPTKVERDIQSSKVSRDVARMFQRSGQRRSKQDEWDGQWTKPHGERDEFDGSDGDENLDDCQLGIRRSGGELKPAASTRPKGSVQGFVSASSVLKKYEEMEVKSTGKGLGGFVKFRQRDFKMATLPEHLRKNAPDPLASFYKPKDQEKHESSKEIRAKLEQMRAELDKKRKESAERLAVKK